MNRVKSDRDLQYDVLRAIKWEPLLQEVEIGVVARDGIITLSGIADSYAKKLQAGNVAKSITGVREVRNVIDVFFGNLFRKEDTEIARAILDAWNLNGEVPREMITVKVEQGWVTLEGKIQWYYQKEAAERTVAQLHSIKGVINNILVLSESKHPVDPLLIEEALLRNWCMDDHTITVSAHGNKVTLTGRVSSLYQKEEAGRLAWNAPGVGTVDNEISVLFP